MGDNEILLQNRYRMMDILRIDGTGDRYAKYTIADTQDNDKILVAKEMIISATSRQEKDEIIERFISQGQKFMQLNHPCLCKVTDCFSEKGCLYLIMEFIVGEYLDEILQTYLLKTKMPFSEKQVIEVSFRICEALEYLHSNDILCGTLQPTNIMFSRDTGRLVLIDFGISRILIPEPEKAPIYIAGFSPPEQYEGIIEPRSDIYGLGVIMHYLLSGTDPAIYNVQFSYPPLSGTRTDLSKEIEAVVNKALQKDMANRFSSATEMKGALGVVYQRLAKTFVKKASWTMLGGNTERTGSQGEPLKGIPRFRWKYKAGRGAISSPAIVNNMVYVAAYDNYIYAINTNDGSCLWEYKVRGQLASSPIIYEGTLYVGCMDCNLYSIDINAICLKWKYKTDGLITGTPAMAGEAVFTGSYDSYFYAIDVNGGRLIWKFNAGGTVMSSPVVFENIVYFGSLDSHIYALATDSGELKWKFKTGYSISSSPCIYQGKVFIGSYDGHLYSIDINSGEPVWGLNTSSTITSTPVVSDGIVYIGTHSGHMIAIDTATGKPLWNYKVNDAFQTSPAISGGILYFYAEKTRLFILDGKTGQIISCIDSGIAFSSSPAISDGLLILGTSDGFIYGFK